MATVTCPTCGEDFEVLSPGPLETPCTVDYDCEVCCSPMEITFECEDDGEGEGDSEITGWARGLVE